MYKFAKILFFICIFIICGFGGAYLTKQALGSQTFSALKGTDNNQLLSTNQMKLIVFYVDEIEHRSPILNSVWAVNIYYDEPYQLTFIPLTNLSDKNFNKLSKHFFINEKNELAETTLTTFKKYFNTNWDGSIVIDQAGAAYFLSRLTENQIAVTGNFLEPEPKRQNLFNFCDYLNEKTTPISNTIDWALVSSNDFITSLSVHETLLGIQTITGETPPKCRIIQSEN